MPIYEYQCSSCGNTFEEWCRHFDDDKIRPCPSCSKDANRVISQTSFALKGEGWYVTEYGSRKSADTTVPANDTTAAPSAQPAAKEPVASPSPPAAG